MPFIASIVEGHGETEALPVLLRRMVEVIDPSSYLVTNPPIRVKASAFFKMDQEFVRNIELAAAKAAPKGGGVLILLDCEDACPASLGPALLAKAKSVRADVPYLVVLAHKEFETWFIAAAASLRDRHGLPGDLATPEYFADIRDAKGWLGRRMVGGYKETEHQAKFAATFDLGQAESAVSFKRFRERLPNFLAAMT